MKHLNGVCNLLDCKQKALNAYDFFLKIYYTVRLLPIETQGVRKPMSVCCPLLIVML